jgi:hypothetical protein
MIFGGECVCRSQDEVSILKCGLSPKKMTQGYPWQRTNAEPWQSGNVASTVNLGLGLDASLVRNDLRLYIPTCFRDLHAVAS